MEASTFWEELDRQLTELAEADQFSGVVCLSQGADLLFHRAYGYSNRADLVPNETGTRFGTASLTKTFTATAVGLLADEGKLHFHAPVHEYLDFLPEHVSREVTVHHLLTHTSGIGDYFDEDALGSAAYEQVWENVPMYRIRTPADVLPLFLDQPSVFAPGAGSRYNGAGYILLGLVIEALSGQAYAKFVTERVFKAAGMGGSGFFAMNEVLPRVAVGYIPPAPEDGSGWRTNQYAIPVKGIPDGGAYCTAEDLCRFMDALLGGRIVTRETREAMVTPYEIEDDGWRYGYSIMLGEIGGIPVTGNGGEDPGFSARLWHLSELCLTLAVTANISRASSHTTDAILAWLHRVHKQAREAPGRK
jgi:CubicO group peptidase (beta-lactamase class C family)